MSDVHQALISSHLHCTKLVMEAADRLYRTRTGRVRDEGRFERERSHEEAKVAPFQGPKVVKFQSDTSEQNKLGQVGDLRHRGTSRNALGGFYTS